MRSYLISWFLNLKLEVTVEEALRLRTPVLDLRSHGLEECPNFVTLPTEYVNNIKCLLLQSNLLEHFSLANCYSLRNLKGLTLDYNRLEDIPFPFRHLKNLTILNVSHNTFLTLHFFHVVCQLKNLKVLWANATGIKEIPKEIEQLTKLRILGLRRNYITRLPPELLELKTLRWLTLASNEIFEIPSEINHLSNVVHLNLQRNYISTLPKSFDQLQELQYLSLDYNQLIINDQFKSFISSLPNLKHCSFSNNVDNNDTNSDVAVLIEQIDESERTQLILPTLGSSISLNTATATTGLTEIEIGGEVNDSFTTEGTLLGGNTTPTAGNSRQTVNGTFAESRDTAEGNLRLLGRNAVRGVDDGVRLMTNDNDRPRDHDHFQQTERSALEFIIEPGEDSDVNHEEIRDVNPSALDMVSNYVVNHNRVEHQLQPQFSASSDRSVEQIDEIDYELPFANSSVASIRTEVSASSSSGVASVGTLYYETDPNGNSRKISSDRGVERHLKLRRTQEWILHHNNHALQAPYVMCENDEPHSHQSDLVQGQGDDDDFNVVSVNTETPVPVQQAVSSASLIYIMPYTRKPNCANFTCSRTVSSSVVVSPSESPSRQFLMAQSPLNNTVWSQTSLYNVEGRVVESTTLNLHSHSPTATPNNNVVNATSSSNLEADDVDSNYDLTDWEHSPPSSAIDDQDILVRFAELGDEEPEYGEYVPLDEFQWLRILGVAGAIL